MKLRRLSSTLAAAALATAAAIPLAGSASADGDHGKPLGTRSLAEVLTSDGNTFDHNWHDYDIVTEAVLAVLKANPKSPVGVLTDGNKALTAFVPDDQAFRILAKDLTGHWQNSEQKVFQTLASTVGVGTIEKVLLYHVVPGKTIDSRAASNADDARLATALPGASIVVDVDGKVIRLQDNDPNDRNPRVVAPDINKGNKQIAHGISLVLRPADL